MFRADGMGDRPFVPPRVAAIPEVPEPGLLGAARYAVRFVRASWQRREAIRALTKKIKQDTAALDHVLGALGRAARAIGVEGRVFTAENAAISAAEQRRIQLEQERSEVETRRGDENVKFSELESGRTSKVGEAERALTEAQDALSHLEAQRRGLRDQRKELERRQRAYLKAAEDRDGQAGAAEMGQTRTELRQAAEAHRKEAAALEPERQELDRKLAAQDKPIADAQATVDLARADLETARRSLSDAREGHGHRLAELEAEQKRKAKEIALAEGEIVRRMVTLGTLVNLNRVDKPEFAELYERVDRLRGAIGARTTEVDKLTAERAAYDRGSLARGGAVWGGGLVLLILLVVILIAAL